jgi:hypothetical protein
MADTDIKETSSAWNDILLVTFVIAAILVFALFVMDRVVNSGLREKRVFLESQEKFWKITDNILENNDLKASIEDLKMAYSVVFKDSLESNLSSTGLIGSLMEYRVALLSGEHSTSPEKHTELALIIKRLREATPYSDLPREDREVIISIKTKMEQAVAPETASTLMANLTNKISEKNSEIRKYQDETQAANRWSVLAGIIALITLPLVIAASIALSRRTTLKKS